MIAQFALVSETIFDYGNARMVKFNSRPLGDDSQLITGHIELLVSPETKLQLGKVYSVEIKPVEDEVPTTQAVRAPESKAA